MAAHQVQLYSSVRGREVDERVAKQREQYASQRSLFASRRSYQCQDILFVVARVFKQLERIAQMCVQKQRQHDLLVRHFQQAADPINQRKRVVFHYCQAEFAQTI